MSRKAAFALIVILTIVDSSIVVQGSNIPGAICITSSRGTPCTGCFAQLGSSKECGNQGACMCIQCGGGGSVTTATCRQQAGGGSCNITKQGPGTPTSTCTDCQLTISNCATTNGNCLGGCNCSNMGGNKFDNPTFDVCTL